MVGPWTEHPLSQISCADIVQARMLCYFAFTWTVSYCLALCGLGQLPCKNKRIYNWLTAYLQDKGGLDKRELELFSHELTFKFNFV